MDRHLLLRRLTQDTLCGVTLRRLSTEAWARNQTDVLLDGGYARINCCRHVSDDLYTKERLLRTIEALVQLEAEGVDRPVDLVGDQGLVLLGQVRHRAVVDFRGSGYSGGRRLRAIGVAYIDSR
jgi:hypothetical protein